MRKDLMIKKPVIIIGCPRSGTSLLFTILSTSKHLWSLYRESNDIWENFYRFTGKEFKNEVLTGEDLSEESKGFLLKEFHKYSFNNYYTGYFLRECLSKNSLLRPLSMLITEANLLYKNLLIKEYRLVEKTPKNCFRISFINKLFRDCKFIFLKRDGRSNIHSLIEGWKLNGKYIRMKDPAVKLNIKGYDGKDWNFVMPPGWENHTNKSLEKVCAFQWISSNKAAIEGLKEIEEKRKYTISYEDLSNNTYSVIKELCDFIEIPFSGQLRNISYKPPDVNYVSRPQKEKWKKNAALIEKIYPQIEPVMKELGYPSP
ncbi:MAG: hypothetical protein A3I68_07285 [Candidatus Melainabacteria bacterium RIFCSPLOWO2_02_FULL_35_15]|nr:MAG: hypothetical protein A3F80_03170 [Candidatus Melainabacteria bacterium RIFCSPLOWO2_12_FULL_35_11]OGI12938.1 MAG: hypothetical protein A3I68_07285 [Candidatus Melainabacteria bacterium RIFCSPLOWO2_02_FULL_35_15]